MKGAPINERKETIDTSHGCILYVENLSVSFDGFKALNDLNLYIDDGELRCELYLGPWRSISVAMSLSVRFW